MAYQDTKFTGTIPAAYDEYLGPVIFAPYAEDLARRVRTQVFQGRLLEIACGTGILTRRLDAELPGTVRIIATDLNEAMLEHARAKLRASARLEWQVADASSLQYPSAAFDAVVSQFGLMFIPSKIVALREARRVLKSGGGLFFNVWSAIEENAFAQAVHDTVSRFFELEPPTFYQIPFGYHDEPVIETDLEQAGFVDVVRDRVGFSITAPSARQFARGLVEGNPLVHSIREARLPIPPIIDAVTAALVKEGGDAPFRSQVNALVYSARVP